MLDKLLNINNPAPIAQALEIGISAYPLRRAGGVPKTTLRILGGGAEKV
jgi:hypothetical protein